MPAFHLIVNGKPRTVELDDSATPLLWVLRDSLGLVGTKFGCGIAQCGACTVHVDGQAVRSCMTPVSTALGKSVTTIEGLSEDGSHPLQVAWQKHNVKQCGYCQAGQIISAADLLSKNPSPSADEIDSAMVGNICRCGTYVRIRKAIADAAEQMEDAHE